MAVLVVMVVIAGAVTILATALAESRLTEASLRQTRVLYVAEAGLHASAADIFAGGDGVLGSPTSPRRFGGGEYYVTSTDLGNDTFEVTCDATLGGEKRAIRAVFAVNYLHRFTSALFGDIDLGATGSVFVDSYDSTVGSYPTQVSNTVIVGSDVISYANAGGNLGSNGDINVRGGVVIMGNATPGPSGSVTLSGTSAYVAGATTPATETVPLATLSYEPTVASSGALKASAVLATGTYRYDSMLLAGADTLLVTGDATLFVDGDIRVSGTASIQIAPGATLTVYHNGSTATLGGLGVVNLDQHAEQFQLYTAAKTVTLAGSSDLYGAIYAPQATVSPTGTSGMYGSVVAKEVFLTGTTDFHYDEDLMNLKDTTEPTSVEIVSWYIVGTR